MDGRTEAVNYRKKLSDPELSRVGNVPNAPSTLLAQLNGRRLAIQPVSTRRRRGAGTFSASISKFQAGELTGGATPEF